MSHFGCHSGKNQRTGVGASKKPRSRSLSQEIEGDAENRMANLRLPLYDRLLGLKLKSLAIPQSPTLWTCLPVRRDIRIA